ncbi:MAG: DUF1801 domain-containing protein [Pseudomonadota bacterium]
MANHPPKLLSGGNPQIAKGYGRAPVAAYLDAMPGWKERVGRQVDGLIRAAHPEVVMAVKWNSPFYGRETDLWYASFHCFTHYVKVTFFDGVDLDPVPPGTSKHPRVRYLDIREDTDLDEARFSAWITQALDLPGERL